MKKRKMFTIFSLGLLFMLSGCFGSSSSSSGSNSGSDSTVKKDEASKPEFSSGTGTEDSPYVIDKDYQWLNINNHLDSCFVLNADLNLGDYEKVSPVGTNEENVFTGNIEGNNHTVAGAFVYGSKYNGLFGLASGATIKNLTFSDSTVEYSLSKEECTSGCFIGEARKNTLIENCHVNKVKLNYDEGSGTGIKHYFGGFVGRVASLSNILYCSTRDFTIKNTNKQTGMINFYGGFCSVINSGSIDMCFSKGTVVPTTPQTFTGGANYEGGVANGLNGGTITNVWSEVVFTNNSDKGCGYIYNKIEDQSFSKYVISLSTWTGSNRDKVTSKYYSSTTTWNKDDIYNKYFKESDLANCNDVLDSTGWATNTFWEKGKIHPELISYEKYKDKRDNLELDFEIAGTLNMNNSTYAFDKELVIDEDTFSQINSTKCSNVYFSIYYDNYGNKPNTFENWGMAKFGFYKTNDVLLYESNSIEMKHNDSFKTDEFNYKMSIDDFNKLSKIKMNFWYDKKDVLSASGNWSDQDYTVKNIKVKIKALA